MVTPPKDPSIMVVLIDGTRRNHVFRAKVCEWWLRLPEEGKGIKWVALLLVNAPSTIDQLVSQPQDKFSSASQPFFTQNGHFSHHFVVTVDGHNSWLNQ